jgi:hypothetical protein
VAVLIGGLVGVAVLLLVRRTIDRQARPKLGGPAANGVPDAPGEDGMAPALLRRRTPWSLPHWRGGAINSLNGSVRWESRLLHRRVDLSPYSVTAGRAPTSAQEVRWAPDRWTVITMTGAGRTYDCAVYEDQAGFVMAVLRASEA